MEDNTPVVEDQQQASSSMKQDYCICKRVSNSQLLFCANPSCPCKNYFHPGCFGMDDKDVKKALASNSNLCPLCSANEGNTVWSQPPAKKVKVQQEDSDEEFSLHDNDMDEMLSDEDAYSNSSLSDADTGVPNVRRRSSRLGSVKGHPWSDDDEDNNRKKSSTRSVASTDASEYDTTRKSTRIRRRAFSPQGFMSQESDESETEEVLPYTIVPSTDSGSKIEKILGRRVLPNTEEEALLLKRSRMAIGIHNEEEVEVLPNNDFSPDKFEYLVKWKHQSYSHSSWVSYDLLIQDNPPHGKSRFYRFLKLLPRDEAGMIIEYPANTPPEQFFNPNFTEIERVVACSKDMNVDLESFWKETANDIISSLSDICINGYYYIDPFMNKVDEVLDGAFGYYSVIKNPMWMNLIISKMKNTMEQPDEEKVAVKEEEKMEVEKEMYSSIDEFFSDMELMFSNCRLYNSDPECGIIIMCTKLEEEYGKKKAQYYEKLSELKDIINALDTDAENEIKYLVKWVDLSYKDCTWESASQINSEMIKSYEQRQIIPPYKLQPPKTKAERVILGEKAILHFKDNKTLRDYQWEGFRWMKENYNMGKNSILADEMGLGKTIQVISLMEHVIHNMQSTQPILVIAPLSTLGFWRREIESWTTLNVIMYHDNEGGKEVRRLIERYEFYYSKQGAETTNPIYKFDILLTTYEIAIADVEDLKDIKWSLVVVDEAQRMKNKSGKLQQTLHMMRWQQCVLLTGTPLQNNMTELWTLLNFVSPINFPSASEFLQQYGNLHNQNQVASLQRVLREFVLRRLKEDVEGSIPPKQETIIDVEMTTKQKTYYRAIYDHNRDFFIRGYIHTGLGLTKVTNANKGPRLVNMEIQFRKCCNHPYLLEGVEAMESEDANRTYTDVMDSPLVQSSGKMVLLHKLLTKLKAEDHRVLIFSQFTMMLDLIERYLRLAGHTFTRIDGSVRGNAREDAIKSFNEDNSSIFCFLLSTRAGGVGITLTSADTVIIFDSDWNPQNDVQAQARCHRIGQTKAVRVYRLITRGTYESAMFQRASMKLGLEQAVMSNTRKGATPEVVETLLKEGAYSALLEDKEGEEQSKVFCESDINDLLEKRSRVVTYDKTSNASIFSKTSFVSSKADSKLDVNDPMFWKKVFGEDSRETILERLEDGRATKDEATKEKYLKELSDMCNEVIEQKLSGENVPEWYSILHSALKQIISLEDRFTQDERKNADHLLREIEKPSRKRKQVATSGKSNITEDSYSLADPDYSSSTKDALADEVCCKCYRDYYLIRCTGPCKRCFHPECTENPPTRKQKDTWKCVDCMNHKYECMICHQEGYDAEYYEQMIEQGLIEPTGEEDENIVRRLKNKKRKSKKRGNDDDYEAYNSHGSTRRKASFKQNPLVHNPNVVFKCLVKTCGRFYHINCIQSIDYGSKEHFSDLTRFRCPCHFCCTCHVTGNTKHLVQCMMCSNASHVGCLTKESGHRMSKLYYICSKHELPRGIPTWDPNKKKMITDESAFGPKERYRQEKRSRSRPPAEKPVFQPIEYTVPIEEYKGNWCRYCGARRSSGFMKGPWGPKTLCVVHYVAWFRTKKLDLSAYPELPTKPINLEANSEPKYMYYLETKKQKEI